MHTLLFLALLAGICPSAALADPSPAPPATEAAVTPPPAPPGKEEPPLGVFTFLTKIPGDYAASAKTLFARDTLTPWLIVVGSTAGLIKYDYELWKPFHDKHETDKGFHDTTEFGWNVGKGGFQFGIAGGFLAAGAIFGDHRALRTASQIVEVVIVTGIVTQVLKHIAGRESPNVATDVQTGRWHWFPNPAKYSRRVSAFDAFPSGHIATTFATAQVIEMNYPDIKWVPYVTYPIVGFVAVSMVATNGHWWSDYPLSFLLGYHFAKAVTRGNGPVDEKSTAWQLDPFIPAPGAAGAMLSKRF
ncbi:MAG: phosphatase PAP2 family protein [Bdellovibrionota bacterium]